MKLPLALSLRVREAGWLWSGAIGLDTPGDQFCKIRHRYAALKLYFILPVWRLCSLKGT